MANLTVREQNGGQLRTQQAPFDAGSLRELLRWDPFREMMPSFAAFESATFAPAFEVKETKSGYVFTADMPGVLEKDIDVTRTGNRLTISGKRESQTEEKGDTYYACERNYGSFSRAFTMPDGIDESHIRADLKDGVLTVIVPKRPEAQPQKIAVKPAEKKS